MMLPTTSEVQQLQECQIKISHLENENLELRQSFAAAQAKHSWSHMVEESVSGAPLPSVPDTTKDEVHSLKQ
eukprot:11108505-Karenia_brevis.AAC.1